MKPYLSLSRRQSLLTLTAWATLLPAISRGQIAPAKRLPWADHLPGQLQAALSRGLPLVVMVSLDGCPFCKIARQNYLLPMWAEGQPVVQVDWRSSRALTDLAGRSTTHDVQVRAWGVKIAPTLLFLGAGGHEVAERLIGATSLDFYGGYLDDRLERARSAATKSTAPIAPERG